MCTGGGVVPLGSVGFGGWAARLHPSRALAQHEPAGNPIAPLSSRLIAVGPAKAQASSLAGAPAYDTMHSGKPATWVELVAAAEVPQ
jgi:hypothetical protein